MLFVPLNIISASGSRGYERQPLVSTVKGLQPQLNLIKGISKDQLFNIKTVEGEGAFAVDQDGRFLYMNESAEDMLGWKASDLLSKNFFNETQFKVDAIASIGASRCEAINSVGCAHLQNGASLLRRDGLPLHVSYITIPIFDTGRMVGKVYVFREIISHGKAHKTDVGQHQLLESVNSYVVKVNSDAVIIYSNEHANRVFGDRLLLALPSQARLVTGKRDDALTDSINLANHAKTLESKVVHVAWTVTPLDPNGEDGPGHIFIGNDITELTRNTHRAMEEMALVHKVFDQISDGVIALDEDGMVQYVNPAAEQLTGWAGADATGLHLQDIFQVVDERTHEPLVSTLLQRALTGRSDSIRTTCMLIRRDGWEFIIAESSTTVRDINGATRGAVIAFRDISELHGLERWMATEAPEDALTGLLSRSEFESRLSKVISDGRVRSTPHALGYIRMLGFEQFQQDYGAEAIDALLRHLSGLLNNSVRKVDVLGRVKDAVFAVLFENCDVSTAVKSIGQFCKAVDRLPLHWHGVNLELAVAAGVVPVTATGGVNNALYMAESACFVANHKGPNKVHAYEPKVAEGAELEEMQWVYTLREALQSDRLRLFCQSIVPLNDPEGQVLHHEILLRLHQEDGQLVRPRTFIHAAERFHLMPAIDRWVVRNSLRLLADRLQQNPQLGMFSINLSAQSIDDEAFLHFVVDEIEQTGVPHENICFEISEETAINKLISASRFISTLRGIGCRFCLDNFGKGFSSYNYLKNLQVDYIKIDGSYVRELVEDKLDLTMVESLNKLCHLLGVQTIAAYVESEEILEQLINLGIDHVQGYQLSRPRPLLQNVTPVTSGQGANAQKKTPVEMV